MSMQSQISSLEVEKHYEVRNCIYSDGILSWGLKQWENILGQLGSLKGFMTIIETIHLVEFAEKSILMIENILIFLFNQINGFRMSKLK